MPNSIAYATLFQNTLDTVIAADLLTGWMDANASQVIYNGGATVKIPKLSVQGLGTYNRSTGYVNGDVTLTYGTYEMTQDRGRKFSIDAMDVNEANFVPTAATIMGEFQRTQVVPEIDAYRIATVATKAISASNVEYAYTPASATILTKIKDGIKAIRENGYQGQIVIHANPDVVEQLELALGTQLHADTFSRGGVDTRVPYVDGCPVIQTPSNRMYSALTIYDGTTSGQTAGGYAKASTGKDVNFICAAQIAPIAVTKQDFMKIFAPDENQSANAWLMAYRRYHDCWVMDNKAGLLWANIKQSAT